jgi:hypothetical protein
VWLAQLESAIADAQELAWRLGSTRGGCPEARQLYARLETLRREADLLRETGWAGSTADLAAVWPDIFGRGRV